MKMIWFHGFERVTLLRGFIHELHKLKAAVEVTPRSFSSLVLARIPPLPLFCILVRDVFSINQIFRGCKFSLDFVDVLQFRTGHTLKGPGVHQTFPPPLLDEALQLASF